ncbi:hypothetical protein [Scandinavium sp.]|uniref:hypothetical protein n=1 Tax=Scandinavium sp. TaxID=2830653 RepID=UPI0028A1A0A4|nr:hypothetical protein [Scandinavium sp.]
MNYRFNLPWRFYISLLGVILAITYAWDQVDDEFFKFVIKYIGAVFFGLCLVSALILRNGLSELPKNILNAIWNIETAFVFIYLISLTYCYSIYGEAPSKNFTTWAEQHPVLFITLTNSLGFVALARAATAFTDIFKKSIMILHETTADPIGDWIRNRRKTNH